MSLGGMRTRRSAASASPAHRTPHTCVRSCTHRRTTSAAPTSARWEGGGGAGGMPWGGGVLPLRPGRRSQPLPLGTCRPSNICPYITLKHARTQDLWRNLASKHDNVTLLFLGEALVAAACSWEGQPHAHWSAGAGEESGRKGLLPMSTSLAACPSTPLLSLSHTAPPPPPPSCCRR